MTLLVIRFSMRWVSDGIAENSIMGWKVFRGSGFYGFTIRNFIEIISGKFHSTTNFFNKNSV